MLVITQRTPLCVHVKHPLGTPRTTGRESDEAGVLIVANGANKVKCYCSYPWPEEQVALRVTAANPPPASAGVRALQRASLDSSQVISSDVVS